MDGSTAGVLNRAVRRLAASAPDDAALLHRYRTAGDAAAFAALVERHGGLVLGVCRAVLGQRQDAEDICQATFLTLARKAASVRRPGSLGCWLHGVALRLARKARARDGRRRAREQSAARAAERPADDLTWRELRDVLHEELGRLPESLRAPVLLCYWQGLSHGEAARRLGWPPYTFRDRLRRARARLAVRLACRGLAPAALPLLLLAAAADARPPAALVSTIVEAARASPAVVTAIPVITARRAGLLALVLAVGVLAAGAGGGPEPAAAPPAPAEAAPSDPAGDPLPEGVLARLGTVRFRHGNGVSGMALSPDGRTVATVGGSPLVRVWDTATGKERWQGRADYQQFAVAIAPDGKTLAAGGWMGIQFWDVESGQLLRAVKTGRVSGMAFSPDGRLLAVEWQGGGLTLFESATGNRLDKFTDGPHDEYTQFKSVAFTPDGKRLATIGKQTVRLWDLAERRTVREFRADGTAVRAVAFTPDGRTLATGGVDRIIRLWDVDTGAERRALTGHDDSVVSLAFSPDGRLLASGSAEHPGVNRRRERQALRLWEVATGKELARLGDHAEGCHAVAFSSDGATLYAGSDGGVRRWDVATRSEVEGPAGHNHWVIPVAVSPDGRVVATGGGDGTVRLWEPTTGRELRRIAIGEGTVDSVAFSPDGRRLAIGSRKGTVHLWEAECPAEVRRFGEFEFEAFVAFTPDGRSLVSVGGETGGTLRGRTKVWDPDTGRLIREFGLGEVRVRSMGLSPDGRLLVVGGETDGRNEPLADRFRGIVYLLDLATGQEVRRWIAGPRFITVVAFTPDGRTLLTGSFDQQTRLWDMATGKELGQFQGGSGIAVAPDGRSFAATSSDHLVRVYELASRRERWVGRGHTSFVHGTAFAPDGRFLVTGSMDATALVWDLRRAAGAPTDADGLWAALADPDPATAFAAVNALAGRPGLAETVLRGRLRPAAPERDPIGPLIADLDNPGYAVRERSAATLERRGEEAGPALRAALAAGPTLEARRRIERLLGQLGGPITSPETLRAIRGVEALEAAGTPGARALLTELAAGAPAARLTHEAKAALARLGRTRVCH